MSNMRYWSGKRMRYAFISDIHGNDVALEAVMEDIHDTECDKIIVLGDICFRGPAPKRCLDIVRDRADAVLKGNADEWVVRGVRSGEVPDDRLDMMNREGMWAREQLSEDDIAFLNSLPMTLDGSDHGTNWLAFHATPKDLFQVVLPDAGEIEIEERIIGTHPHDMFLYGHIHLPYARRVRDRTIVNLGSVGLPFDGVAEASYAVLDCTTARVDVDLRRVPYDIERAVTALSEAEYPNASYIAEVMRNGRP
ncbi:metallophosphoesterase family protein [Alicyclobacillus dauci]|uniref:Metallophosphatase family protein n=1 Tax=Alicyclobacillus dauci TaxID=1475485 RepID=A0ABY6Z1F3_9BACL|nr:metallophosphoesterase family protein [Alicyclobacillus dauci]WAH36517.1 metallophosphatase family protein [Alicyclobacillus dauci]